MSAPRIITLGCRLNRFESEVMWVGTEEAGLDDAIIINSCAVTGEAERQTRSEIRKARRDHPEARIIVCGCAAQIAPEKFVAMEEVDQVLGNREKMLPGSFDGSRVQVGDISRRHAMQPMELEGFQSRSRALVQIQQGCDHSCTFCIVPAARGPNQSLPSQAIITQVQSLIERGHSEVVLTGADISSYGQDMSGGESLGRLARALLDQVDGLARLRLSSLDPAMEDGELADLLAHEPRLMPHLHFSLQAGNDLVLKRMKRRHSRDGAIRLCGRLRDAKPDVALGADLIAGFPTESDEMFADSLSLIEACGLSHLHVFPYSPRPGTPAARMEQVPAPVRRERARILREAGARALGERMDKSLGATAKVLIETDRRGYTEHYLPERLDFQADAGGIADLRHIARDGNGLIGARAA